MQPMTNTAEIEKIISTKEFIEQVAKGADAWNEWDKNCAQWRLSIDPHEEMENSFENLNFDNFVFRGPVNFIHIEFLSASFRHAKFEKSISFMSCEFLKHISFENCEFQFGVNFIACEFDAYKIDFSEASFEGVSTNFRRSKFGLNNEEASNATKYILFQSALFFSEKINFQDTEFNCDYQIVFSNSFFFGETVSFDRSRFGKAWTTFDNSYFDAKNTSFLSVKFEGSDVDFRNVTFERDVNFSGINVLKGNSSFQETKFKKNVSFLNVEFLGGHVSFREAKFLGEKANFQNILFGGGHADFLGSIHKGKTRFPGAVFKYSVDFKEATFVEPPDFRRSQIDTHFTFHKMKIVPFEQIVVTDGTASKFCRLKELANRSQDHDKELEFFAYELKSKNKNQNNSFLKLAINFYDIFSDFGRSIMMPFVGMVFTFMIYANLYAQVAIASNPNATNILGNAHRYSLAMLTPFAPSSRGASKDFREFFFKLDSYVWLDILSVSETVLGIVFLFLIGLALRNRFRL